MANKKQTSPLVASKAAKLLASPKTPKAGKQVAASTALRKPARGANSGLLNRSYRQLRIAQSQRMRARLRTQAYRLAR